MAPLPKKTDLLCKMVLSHYAPVTYEYGYHFKSLDQHIYTPIIREEVREVIVTQQGHYTVYLPSYSDEKIIKNLKKFETIQWQVFSKHSKKKYKVDNISVMPIQKDKFLESLAASEGVLCNAGFGTTSEALFLKKKLLVIPMKNQYEQHCNVAMLNSMGVPSIKKLNKKNRDAITNWLSDSTIVKVDYPDNAAEIVETIVRNHAEKKEFSENKPTSKWYKHL